MAVAPGVSICSDSNGDLLNTGLTMGEEDTKVTVEPIANGTSSLQNPSEAISGKQVEVNADAKGVQENKKDEDIGPEKMEIDEKEAEVTYMEKKVETEKAEEKDVNKDKGQAETAKTDEDKVQAETDKMEEDTDGKKAEADNEEKVQAETVKMDQDTYGKKAKADDGVSGGATEEDTVMKETVESGDSKDINGAEKEEENKVDTTEADQEKAVKESEEEKPGGKINGKEEGNKKDIKEEEKLVNGDNKGKRS